MNVKRRHTTREGVTHMAKAKAKVKPVETPKVESTIMTPKALATELGINPKSLRGYLRKEFTRPAESKNTSWFLTQEQVEAARKRFTASDEVDETNSDEE
jgi:hypothetical protein